MGFVKRRVSGNYFGGSSLIVPGQGVYSIKKYNNFINKTGISKDNYDDTPQPTSTPTPTPTPSQTPTPAPTNTPTLTPTPTPTPTFEYLIDPILTEKKEYIDVGYNEYLMFVDPTPTPTPTKPPECKCFNFVYTFSGRRDVCTARYTDCNGFPVETRVAIGDNYVCAPDQKTFILSETCNGSITRVVDNGVCDDNCGTPVCTRYLLTNTLPGPCEITYTNCDGISVVQTIEQRGGTLEICSLSIDNICLGVFVDRLDKPCV